MQPARYGETMGEFIEHPGRVRFWKVLCYTAGSVALVGAVVVGAARVSVSGDLSLRASLLWDSIGLLSLAVTLYAVALALTILRGQTRAAKRSEDHAKQRETEHRQVLAEIAELSGRTYEQVVQTRAEAKQFHKEYAREVADANEASALESLPSDDESDLQEFSLEGMREGELGDLPFDAAGLFAQPLAVPLRTRDGVVYPPSTVPINVLGDIYLAWGPLGKPPTPWTVGNLVAAYRSYSQKGKKERVPSLRGQPWFVTFRRTDGSLVTYLLVRTGRPPKGEAGAKRPVVKRLEGTGDSSRWVSIGD